MFALCIDNTLPEGPRGARMMYQYRIEGRLPGGIRFNAASSGFAYLTAQSAVDAGEIVLERYAGAAEQWLRDVDRRPRRQDGLWSQQPRDDVAADSLKPGP